MPEINLMPEKKNKEPKTLHKSIVLMSVFPPDLSMNIMPAYTNATMTNKVNSVPKTRLIFMGIIFLVCSKYQFEDSYQKIIRS